MDDKRDRWTPMIEASHPLEVGTKDAHDAYATAMEMVGNRHSKGALVDLVCWLVQRVDAAEQQLRTRGAAPCGGCHKPPELTCAHFKAASGVPVAPAACWCGEELLHGACPFGHAASGVGVPAPLSLTEEEREHIHQAIDKLGDYEYLRPELRVETSRTRGVLQKLFRFLPPPAAEAAARGVALPAGPVAQVAAGMKALDDGHDPLCMSVLRGKACTCGVDTSRLDQPKGGA